MEITEKEYSKLIKTIEMQDARIKALEKTVEALTSELHKYKNENTPSSMVPPFLKDLEKKVDKEMKDIESEDVPKQNARNARPTPDKIEVHKIDKCPNGGKAVTKRKRTYKRIVIVIKNLRHLQ